MCSTTHTQKYIFNTPNICSRKNMKNKPTKTIHEDQKYDHTPAQDTYSGDIEYDGNTMDTELYNYENMGVTEDTNMP